MRLSELTSAGTLLFLVDAVYARRGSDDSSSSDDDDDKTTSTGATPSSSASASPSSTSSAPPSTSSTAIQFLQPGNATTCSDTTLQWSLPSSSSALVNTTLTLTITNDRASFPPSGSGPSSTPRPPLVTRTLAPARAGAGSVSWPVVDVPAGTYVVVATAADDSGSETTALATSPVFSVLAGADTSCLAASSSSSSSSTGALGAAATGANADNSAGAPSQKKLDPGVLGGVVAGVVVVVVLLILVFTFPHYWKERLLRRSRNRRPGGPYYLF